MNQSKPIGTYAILFFPWLLSLAFYDAPVWSYFIAWSGSFFIFYMSLSGKLRALPTDRAIAEQLMRPIFLMQIIFAGYMCCTSIFYFSSLFGYENFAHVNNTYFIVDEEKVRLTAQCQRYYCLGHAAMVSGIMAFMKYPVRKRYTIEIENLANLLLRLAIITFGV